HRVRTLLRSPPRPPQVSMTQVWRRIPPIATVPGLPMQREIFLTIHPLPVQPHSTLHLRPQGVLVVHLLCRSPAPALSTYPSNRNYKVRLPMPKPATRLCLQTARTI